MKIIVGLGNPGKKYEQTRHNFGFMVLDKLAELNGVKFKTEKKLEADTTEIIFDNQTVLLVKPQTFMNNSGKAVANILNFYKAAPTDLTIIYDDKDLDFGKIRTTGKSSAGHKGVESIISFLKTNELKRIRLGINSGSDLPTESFVLQKFNIPELEKADTIISEVLEKFLLN